MHTVTRSFLLVVGLVVATGMRAQQAALRAGDKAYDALAYVRAIGDYERAARQGAPDSAFADRLARSYYAVRDLEHAGHWFARAVEVPGAKAEDLYLYAQTLRAAGRYEEADQWLQKYQDLNELDSRSYRQAHATRKMRELQEGRAIGCDIRDPGINTAGAEMGAAYVNGAVVFASDRRRDVAERQRHAWNARPFLDLYHAIAAPDGSLSDPQVLAGLDSKFHEAIAAFTPDGSAVYFTRNNYRNGTKGTNAQGVMDLKIYTRQLVNGQWMNETAFTHNGEGYSTAHPALSPDGRTLYFASDMPGGLGGTDIWRCTWEGSDWGRPVNLGSTVNTEGDELFPFMSASGDLFFASDGHLGLGGLDIFSSRITGDRAGAPLNPGAPINSDHDDFALVLDASGLHGYFTSDRPGGKGSDDLYAFSLTSPLGPRMHAAGHVTDHAGTPLPDALIELRNEEGQVVHSARSASDGSFTFDVDPESGYSIAAAAEGHRARSVQLSTGPAVDTTISREVRLVPLVEGAVLAHVTDARTHEAVPGALVQITGLSANEDLVATTDATGDLRKDFAGKALGDTVELQVLVTKEGYFPEQGRVLHVLDRSGQIRIDQLMDMALKPMEVGTDIGRVIDLKPIHFDVNKADIRPDAAAELDKVVALMEQFPTMRIELGSHTDSRGNKAANQALSAKRAKSSVAYIVGRGIGKERIKGKGYGESKPLNRCKDRVPCTEEEYELNRRTEFIITRM